MIRNLPRVRPGLGPRPVLLGELCSEQARIAATPWGPEEMWALRFLHRPWGPTVLWSSLPDLAELWPSEGCGHSSLLVPMTLSRPAEVRLPPLGDECSEGPGGREHRPEHTATDAPC